jgi:hypothetical protein
MNEKPNPYDVAGMRKYVAEHKGDALLDKSVIKNLRDAISEVKAGTSQPEPNECGRCGGPLAFRRDCHRCGVPLCDAACEEWHIEKDCPGEVGASPTPATPNEDTDYIEAYIQPKPTKFVSSRIIKGRRIVLRGIELCLTWEDGKVDMQPSIPALSPALRLLKDNPEANDITWNGKEWELTQ